MIFKSLMYYQSCLHDLNLLEIRINIIRFHLLDPPNLRSILYENTTLYYDYYLFSAFRGNKSYVFISYEPLCAFWVSISIW